MTTDSGDETTRTKLPPMRALALLVTLGYAGLAMDLRLEHVDIVREKWQGWIPIVYALLMVFAGIIVLIRWRDSTRRVLFWLYLLAFAVSGYGFWLHNHGKIGQALSLGMRAWYSNTLKHPHGPPNFAPFAFCGLGLLGLLATAKSFQHRS